MLGFLDWIVNLIETLFSFLINTIESLITFLLVLNDSLQLPFMLIGFAPAIIGASISAVVAIGVVKLILGWGNT